MTSKILFVYPTPFRITGLPVGIASLVAVLKQEGHAVQVFDTAFYRDKDARSQTEIRAERLISKEVKNEDVLLPENISDMTEDLIHRIRDFHPDLIGFSILELMYATSVGLARAVKKEYPDIPIIAGGVFPTLSPEFVVSEHSFDIICQGEGETSLRLLTERISSKKPYSDVEGLWVREGEAVTKNPPSILHDINTLPFPDFSEFDPRLFYKAMQGKMYRMINIETSRGCINNCTYCAAPQLRKFFRANDCGKYNRNMNMDKIIEQIRTQIERYSPEFIYFSSENFLSLSDTEFRQFIEAYEDIQLPFWIQTRIETLSRHRIDELKRVGMLWLTIGLEHGNEEFRRRVLKRHYSNEKFIEKMGILKELGIGASVNNIIGFPGETRELIFDTIQMNKKLYEQNNRIETNVFLFTPYHGCELFGICHEKGLVDDQLATSSSHMTDRSVLKFSDEHQRNLTGLVRTFNLYTHLPESLYDQIKIAELATPEGNAMLKRLTEKFLK